MRLRALLASLAILAAGLAVLSYATDGFRAFTTETARRIEVREHPRLVPDVLLQTANAQPLQFRALRGRWLLVDFIYTRCPTLVLPKAASSHGCRIGWQNRLRASRSRC